MQLGNKSVFFSWLRKCVRLFLPLGMRVQFFCSCHQQNAQEDWKEWFCCVRFERKFSMSYVEILNRMSLQYKHYVAHSVYRAIFFPLQRSTLCCNCCCCFSAGFSFFLVFNSNILLLLCLREFMHSRYVFSPSAKITFQLFFMHFTIFVIRFGVCVCVSLLSSISVITIFNDSYANWAKFYGLRAQININYLCCCRYCIFSISILAKLWPYVSVCVRACMCMRCRLLYRRSMHVNEWANGSRKAKRPWLCSCL